MNRRWYAPLDPECPDVIADDERYDDPIMRLSGCADEFRSNFESQHRSKCRRCQLYGAENIEIAD